MAAAWARTHSSGPILAWMPGWVAAYSSSGRRGLVLAMTALDGWPLVEGPFGACGAASDGGLHHGLQQLGRAAVDAVDGLDDHTGGLGDGGQVVPA